MKRIFNAHRAAYITIVIRDSFRAYSFGHLQPRKSFENGRLRREYLSYQTNTHCQNSRVGRLCREKFQTTENSKSVKKFECYFSDEGSHCNAVHSCCTDLKRKFAISDCNLECLVSPFIHETRLFVISWKSTSFISRRFPGPWKSTISRKAQKNTSKSLGSPPKQNDQKKWLSKK